MGAGRRIPARLPRLRRALRRVFPRHQDQPIGNLLVGGNQREAKADVGLAVKIGSAWHDEDPPAFLQRGRLGTVPDQGADLLTERVQPRPRPLERCPNTAGRARGRAGPEDWRGMRARATSTLACLHGRRRRHDHLLATSLTARACPHALARGVARQDVAPAFRTGISIGRRGEVILRTDIGAHHVMQHRHDLQASAASGAHRLIRFNLHLWHPTRRRGVSFHKVQIAGAAHW